MKEELRKSLTDLIDETLLELEELKKSRFAAAEIDLKGPGEGIAGKPSNGDLEAKKAEDDKKEDEEEKKKKEEEAKKAEGKNEEAAKAEGKNEEAAKAEDKKADDKKDEKEPHKDDPEHEKKEKEMAKKLLDMHKAQEEFPTLMKGYVEERVKPLEDKLSTILDLVHKIADAPVAPKGTTARAVPLLKSAEGEDTAESLSKSEVAEKLFELKKSGHKVDSLDIARAEMGQDLKKITEKYKIS